MAGTAQVLAIFSSSPRSRMRWRRYLLETRRPVHCLLFLTPLVLVYEIGTLLADNASGPGRDLLAHSVIAGLLVWVGLAGFWVPPAVLMATLLVWHRLRRDKWRVRWWVLPRMVGESLLLAVPLFVLSALFEPPRQQAAGLLVRVVEALGAGAYEELVFRLLLISGLAWLLIEVVQLWRQVALWVAVGLAAVLFSLCHFEPIGSELFAWKPFWFKLAAGVYLSVVFVGRGLGVSSGCHAAYNLLLMWVHSGAPG